MTRDEAMKIGIHPDLYDEIMSAECEPPIDATDVEPRSTLVCVVGVMWHYAIAAYRVARGRWYVWRDRPTWVVRWFSEDFASADDLGREAARQAREELAARRMKKAAA